MAKKIHHSIWKRKGFLWVTLTLFLISVTLHWTMSWQAYKSEQVMHGQSIQVSDFMVEIIRDTMENWQSEFLQLIWQVAGLAFLWYAGSPQSKESEERLEEKMNYVIKKLDPEKGEEYLKGLYEKYPEK